MALPPGFKESFSLMGQTLTFDQSQSLPTPGKDRWEWADVDGNRYADIIWGVSLGLSVGNMSSRFLVFTNYADNQTWVYQLTGLLWQVAGWTFREPGFSALTDTAYGYGGNAPQPVETSPSIAEMLSPVPADLVIEGYGSFPYAVGSNTWFGSSGDNFISAGVGAAGDPTNPDPNTFAIEVQFPDGSFADFFYDPVTFEYLRKYFYDTSSNPAAFPDDLLAPAWTQGDNSSAGESTGPANRPFTEFDDAADQAELTRAKGFKIEHGFCGKTGLRARYGFTKANGF